MYNWCFMFWNQYKSILPRNYLKKPHFYPDFYKQTILWYAYQTSKPFPCSFYCLTSSTDNFFSFISQCWKSLFDVFEVAHCKRTPVAAIITSGCKTKQYTKDIKMTWYQLINITSTIKKNLVNAQQTICELKCSHVW